MFSCGGIGVGKVWAVMYSHRRCRRVRPRRWLPRGRCQFWVITSWVKFTLTSVQWKGIAATGAVITHSRDGARPVGTQVAWEYPSVKKKMAKSAEGVKHLAAMETNLMATLMPLVEHCALRQYDDGEAREPGWFTVKTQGAAWIVQVKDPDAGVSFSAVGDTLDKALETAALLLGCDEAPWEMDRFLMAAKSGKGKK